MPYAHITGWGMSVPETILTNDELSKIVDTNDAWIRDYGPLQVETPDGVLWLDTRYLHDRPADDRSRTGRRVGVQRVRRGVVPGVADRHRVADRASGRHRRDDR